MKKIILSFLLLVAATGVTRAQSDLFASQQPQDKPADIPAGNLPMVGMMYAEAIASDNTAYSALAYLCFTSATKGIYVHTRGGATAYYNDRYPFSYTVAEDGTLTVEFENKSPFRPLTVTGNVLRGGVLLSDHVYISVSPVLPMEQPASKN